MSADGGLPTLPGLIRGILTVILLCSGAAGARAQSTDEAAWAALAAGGHVAMIRHANAPGGGDPQGFDLAACETQRNLDDRGRAQAAALGEELRRRGIVVDRLLTSPWCRCRDTASLLGYGAPEVEPALVNLVGGLGDRSAQVPAMRDLVAGWSGGGTLVLVSHGSTISAFTGIQPRSGEVLVLRPAPETDEGFALVGRIPPPS